jgi:alpha-N-arabinofuranosidase
MTLCLCIATQAQNRLTVNADQGNSTISKQICRYFSEHLGHCIYGGYRVGEDSPIPNTRGIRNDVMQALHDIQIPNLRWPGGCFADQYRRYATCCRNYGDNRLYKIAAGANGSDYN